MRHVKVRVCHEKLLVRHVKFRLRTMKLRARRVDPLVGRVEFAVVLGEVRVRRDVVVHVVVKGALELRTGLVRRAIEGP